MTAKNEDNQIITAEDVRGHVRKKLEEWANFYKQYRVEDRLLIEKAVELCHVVRNETDSNQVLRDLNSISETDSLRQQIIIQLIASQLDEDEPIDLNYILQKIRERQENYNNSIEMKYLFQKLKKEIDLELTTLRREIEKEESSLFQAYWGFETETSIAAKHRFSCHPASSSG